jgi:hypothetical protein
VSGSTRKLRKKGHKKGEEAERKLTCTMYLLHTSTGLSNLQNLSHVIPTIGKYSCPYFADEKIGSFSRICRPGTHNQLVVEATFRWFQGQVGLSKTVM